MKRQPAAKAEPSLFDTISLSDFDVLDDTIQLENGIFTKLTTPGVLNASMFAVGAAAADANDYVIYNSTAGALYYDADGNQSGAAVRFATLEAGLALTSGDFAVI